MTKRGWTIIHTFFTIIAVMIFVTIGGMIYIIPPAPDCNTIEGRMRYRVHFYNESRRECYEHTNRSKQECDELAFQVAKICK